MSFVHDVCFDHREKIQNIKKSPELQPDTYYILF